jgi:arginine N-succinyltransferase
LHDKILDSCTSFEQSVQSPGPESYFFVLEDLGDAATGGLLGNSRHGGFQRAVLQPAQPQLQQCLAELNIEHGVPALSLCHDLGSHTLLRGFHIDPTLVRTAYSELLSRARLLFIAAHAPRFADGVISEIVGFSTMTGIRRSGMRWASTSSTCPMSRPSGSAGLRVERFLPN